MRLCYFHISGKLDLIQYQCNIKYSCLRNMIVGVFISWSGSVPEAIINMALVNDILT